MRLTSFMLIGAAALAATAQAQPIAPQAGLPAPVQAQRDIAPAADGVIRQMGPQAPIVQAAPAPAQSYPPCTRGRTDSCYNPDPSKEADVKAASKSDG